MDESFLQTQTSEVSSSIPPTSLDFMQHEESAIRARASRTMRALEPIVYEFTKDKGYLHQYYILREQMYTQVWNLKGFTAQEDDFDRKGMILIARRGNHVVGGLRLNFRDERNTKLLPGESADFEFSKVLPEMNLDYKKIVECTRMAVLTEFRRVGVPHELIVMCLNKSKAMNADYLFFVSPGSQARAHLRSVRKVGMNYATLSHLQMPKRDEYEGIKMDLSYVELQDAKQVQATATAKLESQF